MKKINLHHIDQLYRQQEPIVMLTCYDATFAHWMSKSGIEIVLIGDSLGMTIQGHRSTVPVTMDHMVYHIEAVARGNTQALVMGDMPYMSYITPEMACMNAARLMQAGSEIIKLEGGEWLAPTVAMLTECGIPVCGHIGLQPQRVDLIGGYRVQGRDPLGAEQLISDARALEAAGARMLVLECIPQALALTVTNAVNIPTIGIGAGPDCSGQVLVVHDMLGLSERSLTFCKNFLAETACIQDAFAAYRDAVKTRAFPSASHGFV